MASQLATKQDEWVINRFGERLRDRVYVEVGAHNGIHHSNTLRLRDEFGCNGLLIEANPGLFTELVCNRPHDVCVNVCVDEFSQKRPFSLGGSYGGLLHHMSREWRHEAGRRETPELIMQTETLARTMGLFCPGQDVAYFSLDVEGAELPILRGFKRDNGFRKYQIDCLTVEFRYDTLLLAQLEAVLDDYVLEHIEAFDAFFVRKGL